MLTLADIEPFFVAYHAAGSSSVERAELQTDKGKLWVWRPGSYDTQLEVQLCAPDRLAPHFYGDALEVQCRIIGWDLTLKETE